MLTSPRTVTILETAIQDFIKSGEPISSGRLYEHYDFGIKPAMIRNELQELTENGYLDQPYPSAGRVPSDRGYRFFVERILSGAIEAPRVEEDWAELSREAEWVTLLSHLSSALGVLGVVADKDAGRVYKHGLDDLLEHLDWAHPQAIKQVIKDFEALDGRLEEMRSSLADSPAVWIGKQSPITRSHELSVIAGQYSGADGDFLLIAIGPKWMDYQKVIGVFKNI